MHDYQRVMRRMDKIRRRFSRRRSFELGVENLKKVIHQFFECGQKDWSPLEVAAVTRGSGDIRDTRFLTLLKHWETRGYIRILDTPRCLFTVLKVWG